jgi:hypothetical protein
MKNFRIHFDDADWYQTRKNWESWWNGDLNRPIVMVEDIDTAWKEQGVNILNMGDLVINLAKNMAIEQIFDYFEPRLAAKRFYGDAFPKWKITFGPGIAAGFLGARVFSTKETVWFEPEDDLSIDRCSLSYPTDNQWWSLILSITEKAVKRWGNQLVIAHTDLGGNFDILASLRTTQRLLFELYDSPDDVARLIKQITGFWIRFYDDLYNLINKGCLGTTPWAPIWSPGKCYMMQSDFSYMLSPKMFERYIIPDLDECSRHLDHSFYHMDGKGQIPHLDLLLALDHLHGIQWIPGDGAPPPEEWLPLLKRIRAGGKLVQLFVSPEGALKIVRELGGKGFAFYITEQMNKDDAEDFISQINSA